MEMNYDTVVNCQVGKEVCENYDTVVHFQVEGKVAWGIFTIHVHTNIQEAKDALIVNSGTCTCIYMYMYIYIYHDALSTILELCPLTISIDNFDGAVSCNAVAKDKGCIQVRMVLGLKSWKTCG